MSFIIQLVKADLVVEANDHVQIFTVGQERSWTTLNISHELFTAFMAAFSVFPSFWKCIRIFGTKYDEHECDFPGFQSQRTSYLHRDEAFGMHYATTTA